MLYIKYISIKKNYQALSKTLININSCNQTSSMSVPSQQRPARWNQHHLILQIRRQRHREVRSFAQSHTAREDFNSLWLPSLLSSNSSRFAQWLSLPPSSPPGDSGPQSWPPALLMVRNPRENPAMCHVVVSSEHSNITV